MISIRSLLLAGLLVGTVQPVIIKGNEWTDCSDDDRSFVLQMSWHNNYRIERESPMYNEERSYESDQYLRKKWERELNDDRYKLERKLKENKEAQNRMEERLKDYIGEKGRKALREWGEYLKEKQVSLEKALEDNKREHAL